MPAMLGIGSTNVAAASDAQAVEETDSDLPQLPPPSTILVDPPRAGLDEATLRACANFQNVLYISCNPDTLEPALRQLLQTHSLQRMALFDHFPYTKHVECGVFLVAKPQ